MGRMAAVMLFVLCSGAFAQTLVPIPALKARVTDLTGTLNPAQIQDLEAKLALLEQMKGSQVVVLLVPTTQPEPIEDFSMRVVEAWKIGRAANPTAPTGPKVDDGVLLLVAKQDRKIRIEVGYGLEGAIPDLKAKRIITESIAPAFKRGEFFTGLQAGVDDISALVQGESLPEVWQGPPMTPGDQEADLGQIAMMLLVFGIFATLILGRWIGSAATGLATGATASFVGLPLAAALGLGILASIVVFIMRPGTLARTAGRRSRGGSGPVFLPPGGWGGGFGGRSGGGFGGGGGSFGGGGASGDW